MKIAIQASDLDHSRIDGTRVYLLNMLKQFGKLELKKEFLIYHRKNFNPELTPPQFSNYKFIKKDFPFFWTQTRFAWDIWQEKIDALWMPMHNVPLFKKKNLKTTVTIHDLAFKYFPDSFPCRDLTKLNLLTNLAIKNSDQIIAVSQSTKQDILKFYPQISENKIKVIYHGFDAEVFNSKTSQETTSSILKSYKLQAINYLLYVGAIQPRKNLEVLLDAFELYKKKTGSEIKLVLASEKAWQEEKIIEKIAQHKYREDIVVTGIINFKKLAVLYQRASLFIFPSLYEGFGIPILEAMASKVPVISANNSSLPEVGGTAVEYFEATNIKELSSKIELILSNNELQEEMITRGIEQVKKFSWQKSAQETLDFIS